MGKLIIWTDRARAQLRAIDQATALRFLFPLARLTATSAGDVVRLQGVDPPEYRLRIGDYRLLFHDLPGGVKVVSVKHRREAYR